MHRKESLEKGFFGPGINDGGGRASVREQRVLFRRNVQTVLREDQDYGRCCLMDFLVELGPWPTMPLRRLSLVLAMGGPSSLRPGPTPTRPRRPRPSPPATRGSSVLDAHAPRGGCWAGAGARLPRVVRPRVSPARLPIPPSTRESSASGGSWATATVERDEDWEGGRTRGWNVAVNGSQQMMPSQMTSRPVGRPG